jgi:thioredoxin-dependent peroxiredoxin
MDIGDAAPDFELAADDGRTVKLSDELAKGPVVLFFYPKALTSGCTKESCHFRDLAAEFAAAGAQRIGISADSVERQRKFSDKHSFDFTLLSDPDRAVARQFGVKRPGPLFNKRATFVIDSDRRVIDVIRSETNMDTHADQALATLAKRGTTSAAD